jgi:hypothetical protein
MLSIVTLKFAGASFFTSSAILKIRSFLYYAVVGI